MDIQKEAKSQRGQYIIIGAVLGAVAGLFFGNLLQLVVVGAALGFVYHMAKHKKKSA